MGCVGVECEDVRVEGSGFVWVEFEGCEGGWCEDRVWEREERVLVEYKGSPRTVSEE